ncbi:FAD:protein FMN transferase [Furfurilactobacillus entadae]|uniref:FAD:protein FMN transferase n=1 Tax=Furfurilactobacillus entadae TaxID=2922307 RepID=UPI0035F0BFA9
MKTIQLTAMAMPFTIKLVAPATRPLTAAQITTVQTNILTYLTHIDDDFSPFKTDSLVSRYQHDQLKAADFTAEFQEVYAFADTAMTLTKGAFNPFFNNHYDSTGLVKGWAIQRAFERFLQPHLLDGTLVAAAINGAGDMQLGVAEGETFTWHIGIEYPQAPDHLCHQYALQNGAIATSGTSRHGEHIVRTDHQKTLQQATILSLDLIEADILATAAVSMGQSAFLQFSQQYSTAGLLIDQNDCAIAI